MTDTETTTRGRGGLADVRRNLLAVRERQRATATGRTDRIEPAPRDGVLPVSFAQQRLWFLHQWDPGRPVYNAPVVLRLRADLDVPAFARALTRLVERHEVLRTSYPARNGVPHQVVAPAPAAVPLPVTDFTGRPDTDVRDFVEAEVRRPFDLTAGPMLRAALARVAADEHVLVLAMHHIVTDGWSTAIMLRELVELYRAEHGGVPAELPALPVQYADYAVWQRGLLAGEVRERQLAYWRDRLAGLPTLNLPTDRPRPAEPTRAGATLETLLPLRLAQDLNRLARDRRVTLFTVLFAGFTALLGRYTGQDDIVVGSVFSGRTRPEIEHLLGFFANTLVLRTSTAGNPTFAELLGRTHDVVLGAHLQQDLPFGTLVDELSPERDPSRNPLFQTSFTLQHAAAEQARVGGLEAELYPMEMGTARFDLAVQVTEVPDTGLRLWAEFSTELFDAARIERLFAHYTRILEQVVADPDVRLGRLDLHTPAERARLTDGLNTTARDLGDPATRLHELVEARVDAGAGIAARFGGAELSYADLDVAANRLAHALRAAGAGPETVVGVLLPRGLHLPVALLGVLKAGAAYLPLDPEHPAARWALTLGEAGADLVVTDDRLAAELPEGVRTVSLDDPALAGLPADRPAPTATADNLAYVIFTSGSTGRPKGVAVSHRAIVNFVRGIGRVFRLGPGDRVLQFANPAFDVSLFDFFAPLSTGATIVGAPRPVLLDPDALAALMRDERVTVTDLPPAVLGRLDPATLPELRALFVGLEAFPGELVNRWNTDGREFHNGYGPTEATVACIDYRCPPAHYDTMPPIGTPLDNYRAYVVDAAGDLAADGIPGELLIGGVGLARGYLNRPGLTAERFVPDPFGAPGGRLYRTGDLVRRRPDGVLEFLGRVDTQIKLRGLRIEPAEIEHQLRALPGVDAAVVAVHGTGADARLIAYLTAAGPQAPDPAEVRRGLSRVLPAYLVPADFVVLDELPLGATGKLDRSRLPVPGARLAAPQRVAPRTPTEKTLAAIWAEVLGTEEFGVHDSFFAVGGNSMKITQLVTRIRDAFGVPLELRELFQRSTIAEIAPLVEDAELAGLSDEDLLALLDENEPDR